MLWPPFLKRKSFEHEREVRVLVWDLSVKEHKIDLSRANESHELPVNLATLIESVYISPEAPEWLAPPIRELLTRFGLSVIPVKRFDLYDRNVV